jgi:HAD superfamily hydrolase (TIGR01509 family)
MGMSDDYRIAIDCGSNMVRIGSTIFGERNLSQAKPILPKAVFFDKDGVLFNSMPYHAQSWEWSMNKHGLPFTAEQTYRNEGRTGASVINEAYHLIHGVEAPQELIETIYADKSARFNELTGGQLPELIPGIREVLQYLHENGVQCWVVTGSGQRSLLSKLHDTFPGIFSGIITAFDVTHGKPDPEPYLKAWERSGFAKEECAVVENAPLGVRAGKAAGLLTLAVNTGILHDEALWAEKADRVFPNMTELLHFFQQ